MDESNITLLGGALLLVLSVLTWRLPRKHAVIPLLITTCYIPSGQQFVIAGAHFQFFRVLLVISWLRMMSRNEMGGLKFNRMDKLFVAWLAATLFIGSFADHTDFFDRVISQCGVVYTAAGTYFFVRCVLRSLDELVNLLRFMAWMILPLALFMIVEKFTGRNIFSALGGVDEFTMIRDGKLRCQGAFRSPLLAGAYGVTLFPLFAGLWVYSVHKRSTALVGICCSGFVTMAAASSGALLALLGAMAAFAAWKIRTRIRYVRYAIVALIVVLSFSMTAPVWYIFSRLSDIFGGTGWYRSYIIDMAIKHFNEWWLAGTTYTATWAPGGQVLAANPNSTDIINNYIAEGLNGGIVKLTLFVAMIVTGFKIVGRYVAATSRQPKSPAFLVWAFGVALLCHSLNFFSVAYFDQIVIMWYWLLACLAMISSLSLSQTGKLKSEKQIVSQRFPA